MGWQIHNLPIWGNAVINIITNSYFVPLRLISFSRDTWIHKNSLATVY